MLILNLGKEIVLVGKAKLTINNKRGTLASTVISSCPLKIYCLVAVFFGY